MAEAKFKVGDKVYAPYRGYGIVTKIHDDNCVYPIEVTWNNRRVENIGNVSTFTANGALLNGSNSPFYTITVVGHTLPEEETEEAADSKFKVGDHVWSPHFGAGIVTETEADSGAEYPIKVEWGHSGELCSYDYFTKDGQFNISGCNPDMAIYSVEPEHAAKVIPNLSNELTKKPKEDEKVVDRMEGALSKKVDDAINPSHYQVEGLPEAIDIINHLLYREQYEGFLWGNILKYAYRYGRKGDKAETAGKIAWYATQLKELEERGYCE